jgi:hypothetical protein
MMTPQQRRLRAQIAANARWSHPMARADQADAARAAIFARLEREVDPDDTLPASERAPLVQAAARRLSATLNSARSQKRTAARAAGNLPSGSYREMGITPCRRYAAWRSRIPAQSCCPHDSGRISFAVDYRYRNSMCSALPQAFVFLIPPDPGNQTVSAGLPATIGLVTRTPSPWTVSAHAIAQIREPPGTR